MIPKVINYCWFGGNDKSDVIKKCIESWSKYCPGWEIKEWNETNFDINMFPYAKEAYADEKWAFVSDVARLWVLKNYGGIYLDTDVELLTDNPFEKYLDYDNVFAFESSRRINTGLFMASIPKTEICSVLLKSYENRVYDVKKKNVNSQIDYPVFKKELHDLKWNAQTQKIRECYIIGCEEYGKIMKHHSTHTWCDNLPERKKTKPNKIKKIFRNPRIFEVIEHNNTLKKFLNIYEFLVYDLLDLGPMYFLKRQLLKIRAKKK